jgi:hypothetical protein
MNILSTFSMIERLRILEDFLWGEAAKDIEKTARFLSVEESNAFLRSVAAR